MALKAGYKGFKKLISPLKLFRPGELGIDQDALVEDLDPVFFPRSEQAVSGQVNFCNNTMSNSSSNNVTMTRNSNKTMTVVVGEGGASERVIRNVLSNIALPAGTWWFSGCPSGGDRNTYSMPVTRIRNGQSAYFTNESGVPVSVDVQDGDTISFAIDIRANTPAMTLLFKPMISLSKDTPYAPFAMTNKELTDAISNISSGWDYSSNTVIDTGKKWIDGKPIYCYVKTFDTPVEVSYNSWTGILENVNTVIGKNVLNVLSLQGIGSGTYGGCTPYLAYYDDTNDKINALSTRNAVNTSISKAVLMFTADDSSTPEAVSTTRSTKKSTKKTASADNE